MARDVLRKGLKNARRKLNNTPIPGLPARVKALKPDAWRTVYDAPGGQEYDGQTIMIIGARGALGRKTAYLFVLNGAARIYLIARYQAELVRLRNYLQNDPSLRRENPNCIFVLRELDLSDRAMTRNFVSNITTECTRLHVLLFNAATFCQSYHACAGPDPNSATEHMMQVNCYSQCLIFMALRKALTDAGRENNSPSRATFVTCRRLKNEYGIKLPARPDALRKHLANPNHFHNMHHFHLSKLLIAFWVYNYALLAPVNDTLVVVNMVWPGALRHSNFYQDWGSGVHRAIEKTRALFGRSTERAARVVHAATLGHAGTHGNCLADNTIFSGRDLIMQHAQLGCQRLVYRMIEGAMEIELNAMDLKMSLDPPHDPWAKSSFVSEPWGRTPYSMRQSFVFL